MMLICCFCVHKSWDCLLNLMQCNSLGGQLSTTEEWRHSHCPTYRPTLYSWCQKRWQLLPLIYVSLYSESCELWGCGRQQHRMSHLSVCQSLLLSLFKCDVENLWMCCVYLTVKSKMKLLLYRWSGRLTVSGLVAGEPEETGRASPLPADCTSVLTVATTQPLSITLSDTFSDTQERSHLPAHIALTAQPGKICWRNTSTLTVLRCHSAVHIAPIAPHTSIFCSVMFAYTQERSRTLALTVHLEPHVKLT